MYPESYYIKRINNYKEKIKQLDKEHEDYEALRNQLLNVIDEYNYSLMQVRAQNWIDEADQGLHKEVKFNELPEYVRHDLYSCIDRHKQGCDGDGAECEKCGQMCIAKGYEEFKTKYNIEKITY